MVLSHVELYLKPVNVTFIVEEYTSKDLSLSVSE